MTYRMGVVFAIKKFHSHYISCKEGVWRKRCANPFTTERQSLTRQYIQNNYVISVIIHVVLITFK